MIDRFLTRFSFTTANLRKTPILLVMVLVTGCASLIAERNGNALLGLPNPPLPPDNPQTHRKIELGKALFHDTRFSADGRIGCASCHQPTRAFTDGRAVAKGLRDQAGTRNTPTLFNVAYVTSLFWDGRRARLEDQVRDPFVNPLEHGLGNHDEILKVIRGDKEYIAMFRDAFGVTAEGITLEHVTKSLASFTRSLLAGDSPFDRYYYGGDKNALSVSAINGLEIFRGKGRCDTCHVIGSEGALFTDHQFHSLGIGMDRIASGLGEVSKRVIRASVSELDKLIASQPEIAALGRFVVTHKPADIGRFRTPSLRNVALTAPYMHDGSVVTLEEAVELEIYYRGIEANRPLILTAEEKTALVAYLKSLTSVGALKGD